MINQLRANVVSFVARMNYSDDPYVKSAGFDPECHQKMRDGKLIEESIRFDRLESACLSKMDFPRYCLTRTGYYLLPYRYFYLRFPKSDPLREEVGRVLGKWSISFEKLGHAGELQKHGSSHTSTEMSLECGRLSKILVDDDLKILDPGQGPTTLHIKTLHIKTLHKVHRDASAARAAVGVVGFAAVAAVGITALYMNRKNP